MDGKCPKGGKMLNVSNSSNINREKESYRNDERERERVINRNKIKHMAL